MEEQDKTNKPEECQDLKNLQYKTMLLKGKRTLLLPKNTSDDTAGIEKLLESCLVMLYSNTRLFFKLELFFFWDNQ